MKAQSPSTCPRFLSMTLILGVNTLLASVTSVVSREDNSAVELSGVSWGYGVGTGTKVPPVCTCCGLLEEGEVPVHQAGEELVAGAQDEAEPDEGEEATAAAGKQRAGKELGGRLQNPSGVNGEPRTLQTITKGQWSAQNPSEDPQIWTETPKPIRRPPEVDGVLWRDVGSLPAGRGQAHEADSSGEGGEAVPLAEDIQSPPGAVGH